MASEYFTRLAVEALTEGITNCPRVTAAASVSPIFDCDCEKGLVTCRSIIDAVAERMEAEARYR